MRPPKPGIGAEKRGIFIRPAREHVGGRRGLVVISQRRNQREPSDATRPKRGDLRGERAADARADQVRAFEPRGHENPPRGHHPVELRVEIEMRPPAARKTWQGRRDDLAALRQLVEKRRPARQAAPSREIADTRARALAPDADVVAVQVDDGLVDGGVLGRVHGGRVTPPPRLRPRTASATSGLRSRRTSP